MMLMPIFLPSGSINGAEIIYPKWVDAIVYFGIIAAVIGILWMIVVFILSIITDDRIDILKKPHIYSFALALFGLGVFVIALVLMLITGQKIIE